MNISRTEGFVVGFHVEQRLEMIDLSYNDIFTKIKKDKYDNRRIGSN